MTFQLIQNLPLYSLVSFPLGLLCLSQGSFVLYKDRKNSTNILYFLFCFSIAIWLLSASVLASKLFSDTSSLFIARILYTGVVFIPSFALHFAVTYVDNDAPKNVHINLYLSYFITFLFLIILWTNNNFISGIYKYSWGYYPKAGWIHIIHTIFVMSTAIYGVHLFWQGSNLVRKKEGKNKRYYELKYLYIAFLFVTCGGSDFLHNWGVDFFPIGCFFVSMFILCTTYAIFKHNLLGISIVIRQSLVYSSLVSIVALIYFGSVYLLGSIVGNISQTHSSISIFLILAVITLLFKPLEIKIQGLVNNFFYKPREVIENENVQLRKTIQQQDQIKAVATFASGMAHEIKNPLSAIKTFTEHLPLKANDPKFISKFEKVVGAEVDKIDGIVRQLLEFSKPAPLIRENINVNQMLQETLDFLEGEFVKRGIFLEKSFASDTYPVSADKKQIKQCILNIVLNCIEAMPDGGTIKVSSLNGSHSVIIVFKDSGGGISKEHISHLYDPFFTTKDTGTGLGLSIVYGIVQEHGGKIEVQSEVGKGTTFSVILKSLN